MLPQTGLIMELLLPTNNCYSPRSFVKYMEDTSLYWESNIRQSIKEFLEEMDLRFKNSENKTQRYYVAYTGKRTVITIYGEVTYNRTLYKDRLDCSYYCYVDGKIAIINVCKKHKNLNIEIFVNGLLINTFDLLFYTNMN